MRTRLDRITYGEVYNVEYIQDWFIIFCGFYREKKFKIIVTDFKNFKKELSIDDENKQAIIYGSKIDVIKKLDKNKIFYKSSDLQTKKWFSDLNIKVISAPSSIDNKSFNFRSYSPSFETSQYYLPFNCFCDDNHLITIDQKTNWIKTKNNGYSRDDYKRISVFNIDGTFIKHIPIEIIKKKNFLFQKKQHLKGFYGQFFENGVVISKYRELLYVVNIRNNSIYTYTLKSQNYQVNSISKEGYIIVSTNKFIQVLKIEKDTIVEIAFKETKGLIRYSKILNNRIIVCHSRIIAILNISTLKIEKEIGTNKFWVTNLFHIDDCSFGINYIIRDKTNGTFEREIKIINNFC